MKDISRGLAAQTSMPTVDALHQMKEDLKFKEQQLENSQTTAEKLKEELQHRQVRREVERGRKEGEGRERIY